MGLRKTVEEFKCVSCNTELRALKMISYSCPYCGDLLLPVDKEMKMRFNKDLNLIDNKKVEEAIGKEYKILEIIKNPYFKNLAGQILEMLEILKNPATDFGVKAAIAVALLYMASPIDIIPDVIPGIGYTDDIAILLLTLNFIREHASNIYNEYSLRTKVKYQSAPLIYSISRDKSKKGYNYLEEKGRRIWLLSVDELKEKGYSLLNNSLFKAPENYIGHPYVSRVLIPLSTYDQDLSNSQIEEIVTIARIFGAKDVEIKVDEVKYSIKKGSVLLNVENIDSASAATEKENKTNTSFCLKKYFDVFDNISLSELDQLVWIFTNEYGSSMKFAKERLYHGTRRMEYETKFDSETILQIDLRNEIVKKNKLDIKLKFSNSIRRNIRINIQFHQMPNDIIENRDTIYSEFMELLRKRREAIN